MTVQIFLDQGACLFVSEERWGMVADYLYDEAAYAFEVEDTDGYTWTLSVRHISAVRCGRGKHDH